MSYPTCRRRAPEQVFALPTYGKLAAIIAIGLPIVLLGAAFVKYFSGDQWWVAEGYVTVTCQDQPALTASNQRGQADTWRSTGCHSSTRWLPSYATCALSLHM